MADLLVRFTADVNSHCVGDVVRLTTEDKAETDDMAQRFNIETAYEVVTDDAKDEKAKPTKKAPAKK